MTAAWFTRAVRKWRMANWCRILACQEHIANVPERKRFFFFFLISKAPRHNGLKHANDLLTLSKITRIPPFFAHNNSNYRARKCMIAYHIAFKYLNVMQFIALLLGCCKFCLKQWMGNFNSKRALFDINFLKVNLWNFNK